MSEKIRTGVAAGGLILSIGLAAAGCYQAWAVLPYRVDQTEREVKAMKDERKIDREILIRIEEQVKAMREEMKTRRDRAQVQPMNLDEIDTTLGAIDTRLPWQGLNNIY